MNDCKLLLKSHKCSVVPNLRFENLSFLLCACVLMNIKIWLSCERMLGVDNLSEFYIYRLLLLSESDRRCGKHI